MLFFKHITSRFLKGNLRTRMDRALTESTPQSQETAYYKGLGLRRLGIEYSGEALTCFEQAAPDKKLLKAALDKSEQIYKTFSVY